MLHINIAEKLTSPIHVAPLGTHCEAVFVAEGLKRRRLAAPKRTPTRDKIDPRDTGVPSDPFSES